MSPGVERAVAAASVWAQKLDSPIVRLSHLILALLDEDEGRPALLLERAGLSLESVRAALCELGNSAEMPTETSLFTAARNWSITHRQDPEFLTDAFMLVSIKANPEFEQSVSEIGLRVDQLQAIMTNSVVRTERVEFTPAPETSHNLTVFSGPDITGEIVASRILDANFNRAREATRVLEDYCRFGLDDRLLTQEFKELRHALAEASQRLPAHLLLASRDTIHDVGTSVTTTGEYLRDTPGHVAIVNLKRLQESLRSLEEYGKILEPELSRQLESIRYRSYTLERAISPIGRNHEKLRQSNLYVLLTGSQCSASLDWMIEQIAAGGADIVQLREKDLPDRELHERAKNMRRWTREAGVLLIINDRADIARLVEADGVHLGQDDLSIAEARRIVGPDALIGVSTHSVEQVQSAILDGADYIGIGPVFPSATKVFDHFPGLDFVRAATQQTSLPAFALGGINTANIGEVLAAGARRIAVSAAVTTADDPEFATRMLKAGLATES